MTQGLTDYQEQLTTSNFIAFLNDRLKILDITCTIDEEALKEIDQSKTRQMPIRYVDVNAVPDYHLMDIGLNLISHFEELVDKDLQDCETNLDRIKKLLQTENALYLAAEQFNPDNLWRITQDVKIFYRRKGEDPFPTDLARLIISSTHWDIIKQVFRYRLTLLHELISITKTRINNYDLLLKRHRQYQWGTTINPTNANEIFELALALSLSPSLKCINDSSENHFIMDFMNFFNLPMPKKSKSEGNIFSRVEGGRAKFLNQLETSLEKHAERIQKVRERKK